jgi:multidrug resistance efflux pump
VESVQNYDAARTTYDSTKARVDAAKKQIQAAAAQSQKARVYLDYTKIYAPTNGIVDVRAALEGEVVSAGQAIVTLINPDDLWVSANVEETFIDRIRLGDELQVRLPSGTTRMGTVYYRSVDADYATERDVSRTKRDIKTFEIRLRCDNSDRALAVGMTAYVAVPLR